jgi:hypothetical protein
MTAGIQPSTMSRLTSAQVISLGEYLRPDFDSSSLTVSQLLGVLGYHNVRYPTPYTKAKLVQLFNSEIKTKASQFKKERLKKENSIPSDDGITDGLTGEPLNKGKVGNFHVPIFETLTCTRRRRQGPFLDDLRDASLRSHPPQRPHQRVPIP